MAPRVIHDFTAVDAALQAKLDEQAAANEALLAPTRADQTRAEGERRLKQGLAFLACATGVAAVIAAANLSREPKIVEKEKLVVTEKVVTVEKPVVVEKEVIKTVEIPKPVIVEKPVEKIVRVPVPVEPPAPPAPPAPPIGAPSSVQQFTGSPEFQGAEISGRILSHANGVIRFEGGQERFDVFPNGVRDTSLTTHRHDGDWGFCRKTGELFPNGKPMWDCRALHKGRVEPVNPEGGVWSTPP